MSSYQSNPKSSATEVFNAWIATRQMAMDNEALLRVKPDELAQSLLNRRRMLKESLPGVIRNLEAAEESLTPKLERQTKAHQQANERVAELKRIRDESQRDAGLVLVEVKSARENLMQSGGMVNLDPKWKKERLFEKLEEIEHKIQTSALDHKSEKNMLYQRRNLLKENERWIEDRRESNQEMADFIVKRRKMSKFYKAADKAHMGMLAAVEKAQPLYDNKSVLSAELRDVKSQLDRAKELLSQSGKAIRHWERRLLEGYGDLGPGFPDLLKGMRKVTEGGASSFARKTSSIKKHNTTEHSGGKEK